MLGVGIFSTSPPVSPSPYEVVKGEGEEREEGLAPLLNATLRWGKTYGISKEWCEGGMGGNR